MIAVKEYDKILYGVSDDNQYLSAEEVEKELGKLKEQDEPPVFDSEEEADAYYSEMVGLAEAVEMESGGYE